MSTWTWVLARVRTVARSLVPCTQILPPLPLGSPPFFLLSPPKGQGQFSHRNVVTCGRVPWLELLLPHRDSPLPHIPRRAQPRSLLPPAAGPLYLLTWRPPSVGPRYIAPNQRDNNYIYIRTPSPPTLLSFPSSIQLTSTSPQALPVIPVSFCSSSEYRLHRVEIDISRIQHSPTHLPRPHLLRGLAACRHIVLEHHHGPSTS